MTKDIEATIILTPLPGDVLRAASEVRDVLTANATSGRGLVGVKPREFNRWVIELLGVTNTDTLHDLFPGKGGMDAELAQSVLL